MSNYLRKFMYSLGFLAAISAASSIQGEDKNMDQKSGVPPAQYGMGDEGPSVSIMAAYTLWTAREGGLGVATTNFYTTATSSAVKGEKIFPDNHLRSGFKVGLGANLYHDGWTAEADYTWFRNGTKTLTSATVTNDGLAGNGVGVWKVDQDASNPNIKAVSSNWRLQFNRIGVNVGRSFYAGHYLALRPYMGLLGMWDTQHLNFNYHVAGVSYLNRIDRFENKQTAWGIGIYGGAQSSYFITNDWSIFMNWGAALPWSKFNPTSQAHYIDDISGSTTTTTTEYWTSGAQYYVEPMLEMALGLAWDSMWNDNTWGLRIAAAWEEQIWFSHNHMQQPYVGTTGYGNLSLQGFTFTVSACF